MTLEPRAIHATYDAVSFERSEKSTENKILRKLSISAPTQSMHVLCQSPVASFITYRHLLWFRAPLGCARILIRLR